MNGMHTNLFEPTQVVEALSLIEDAGQVFEVRVLEGIIGNSTWPATLSGYFNDPSKVVEALRPVRSATGIYVTVNPVNSALLARANNRLKKAGKGDSTSDKDILSRRWLLIDADAIRPAGISASDEEHELAVQRARDVRSFLETAGWPQPILGDSGKAPLGYRIEGDKGNKRLLIGDEAAVATVRRIFADYLAGHSLRSIAVRMNEDGVGTPRAAGWSAVTLLGVLTNVTYAGTYRWNTRHKGKYNGVASDCVSADVAKGSNDSADWIVIEDHHPAIIDKATFDKVQARLGERKKITTPHKSGGSFLLTGVIRCGKCGGVMAGRNTNGERYSCFNHQRKGGCDPNAVYQSVLLPVVADAIRDKLLTGNAIDRLKEAIRRKFTASTPKVDANKIGKQLADVASKIERARRRLIEVDSDMLTEVQQHLRGLREQQEKLEAALKLASTPVQRRRDEIGDSVDSIFAGVFRLEKLLRKGEPLKVREAIRIAINRLDVWSDKTANRYQLQRGVIQFAAPEGSNLLGTVLRP